MRIIQNEICGFDIPWYGVDTEGSIAQFFTGGWCPIPENSSVLVEELDGLVDFFAGYKDISDVKLVDVPQIKPGDSHQRPEVYEDYINDLKNTSRKGIYVFDADTDNFDLGEYIKLCYPSNPLKIDDLPKERKTLIKKFSLNCVFQNSERLVMTKYGVKE